MSGKNATLWPSVASTPIKMADYPAACHRGYEGEEGNYFNQYTVPCDSAHNYGGHPGSCSDKFGPIIERVATTNAWSCGRDIISQQYTCTQRTWDPRDKEACCNGSIDNRAMCDSAWCPMSKGCGDSKFSADYCSGKEKDGTPSLTSNKSCRNWCADNIENCDRAKGEYCTQNPESPECSCMRPQDQKAYKEFLQDMIAIGVPIPTVSWYCWWQGCAGTDAQTILKTSNIIKEQAKCKPQTIIMCNQIISEQRKSHHNVINENTFEQICDVKLPAHAEKPKHPADTDHDDTKTGGTTGGGGDGSHDVKPDDGTTDDDDDDNTKPVINNDADDKEIKLLEVGVVLLLVLFIALVVSMRK